MVKRECTYIKILSGMNNTRCFNFFYNNRVIYIHIKNLAACFYVFFDFWRPVNIQRFSSVNLSIKHKDSRKACNMVSMCMRNKNCIDFFPLEVQAA